MCSQQSRCPITGRLFVSYFRCILLQMKISNWTVLCSTGLNTSRRSSNWARTGLAIAEIWPWTKWRESGFTFRLCDKTNSLESTNQNTFRVRCRGGSISHVRLYESNAFASLWRDMELLWRKRNLGHKIDVFLPVYRRFLSVCQTKIQRSSSVCLSLLSLTLLFVSPSVYLSLMKLNKWLSHVMYVVFV